MIGTLLRPGRLATLKFVSPKAKGGLARLTLALALGLLVGFIVFFITYRALRFFSGVEVIGMVLTMRMLEFTLLGVFSFVFLSSLVSALSSFYLSEDLMLVRSAPLPEGPFFMARWLQTTALAAWMVLGFGIPILLAYGAALGGTGLYWGAVALAFFPLLLIPTAIGTGLITGLVCMFPARKVRDLFVILGVVTAALLLLLLRVAQPEKLMRPEVFGSVANYVAAFEAPQSAFFPSTWAAEVLSGALLGEVKWMPLALLWAAVWGFGSVAFLLHQKFYRLAFSRAQEGGPGQYASFAGVERIFDKLQAWLPPENRAFARKDTRLFLRDPGQWSQLLILLTLVVAYVYNYAVFPGADVKLAGVPVNQLLGILNLILAGYVVSALVARFAFPAVSVEGRAFWLVRTSPLPVAKFLRIKYALAVGPLLPFSLILAGLTAYWLLLPAAMMLMTVLHMAVVTATLTALGVGMGALYPKFKFENPAQVPMSFGGILFMMIATVYTIVSALATAWLAYPMLYPEPPRSLLLTGVSWALWLTFHLLHAIIPLRLASRALDAREYA